MPHKEITVFQFYKNSKAEHCNNVKEQKVNDNRIS